MSLFIDTKYLKLVSHRLPRFKAKGENLWNCRCVICGDSTTNTTKARGYFYRQRNDLFYKCHNCDASMHFGTFLKRLDENVYRQYVFERYGKGEDAPKAHTNLESLVEFKPPKFKKDLLAKVCTRLDKLDAEHPVRAYATNRGIPDHRLSMLYAIDSTKDIVDIAPRYRGRIKTTEPRLVLPFFDMDGNLTGVALRAIGNEHLRYINIKLADDETPLIFGINQLNQDKTFFVVEGPIDSLFLPNAIACAGTSFGKLEALGLNKDNAIIVFDNQPRNEDVVRMVEKYIALGYRVCIWPSKITAKDINDMVNEGHNPEAIILTNTYQGLHAKVRLMEWR